MRLDIKCSLLSPEPSYAWTKTTIPQPLFFDVQKFFYLLDSRLAKRLVEESPPES
jgi:hypothetical protein